MSKRTSHSPALVCVLGLMLGACGPNPIPSQPSVFPPPPPPPDPASSPPFTLSGTVFEHTPSGVRPQAGVPVRVRLWGTPMLLDGTSDSAGRYAIPGVPAGAVTIAPPSESGYRAPCPSGTDVLKSNASFDVHVVSTTLLSTSGAPPSMPLSFLSIGGTVFERVPDGTRPVAGATVDLAGDDTDRFVFSTTLTDARGGYLICTAPPGVGTDQIHWVRAQKDGYRPASRTGFPGYDTINLEIARESHAP
jgi:hypothetical protein